MVSVVSGGGLGVLNSSRFTLGGELGQAAQGRAGERITVNAANGNLVIQNQDGQLAGIGADVALLRTYNSQGGWDGDNGDAWRLGYYRRITGLTGTLNAAGSTLKRTDADGFESTYTWRDGRYVGTDGAGAYDSLVVAGGVATWTDGDTGVTETYAEATPGTWRLTQITDPDGHAIKLAYDTQGLIATLSTWKAGAATADETLSLAYDAAKRLTQVSTTTRRADGSLSTQTRTTYTYDSANRLSGVVTDLSPDDNSTADGRSYSVAYTYDSAGRVRTLTQTDGTALTIAYDGTGRVSQLTDALGRITTFAYDTAARQTTVTDALNQTARLSHDSAGRLSELSGAGFKTSLAYDADGNVLSSTNGLGQQTLFAYDGQGNLTRSTDATGRVLERSYDAANRQTGETQSGQTTRYVYDTTGGLRRLRFTVSAEGRVSEQQYNSLGQLSSSLAYNRSPYTGAATLAELATWASQQTAPQRTDYSYDLRGQLSSRTDASGLTRYTFDAFGRLLQSIDANGNTTAYVYDGLDRLTLSTDALGATTVTSYDDTGNRTSVQLANGLRTVSTYNPAGLLIAVAQFSGSTALGETRYAYDAANRLRMTQDPTGQRQWLLYDEAGRKVGDVDALGHLTETRYDAAGRAVQSIGYEQPVNTALLLDAQGNPANVSIATVRPGTAAGDRRQWQLYDAAGRLTHQITSLGEVTETQYDGTGRVSTVVQHGQRLSALPAPGSNDLPTLAYAAGDPDRITRNLYDADGLLRGTLDAEGYLTEMRYDAAGRLVERVAYATATAPAQRSTGALAQLIPTAHSSDRRSVWLYDAQGRIQAEIDPDGFLTETTYNAAGQRTQSLRYARRITGSASSTSTLASLRPTSSAEDHGTRWTYDTLARVQTETAADGTVTRYSYDTVGNLTSTERAVGTAEVRSHTARYDVQGRLTAELSAEGAAKLANAGTQEQIDAVWASYATRHAYDAAGRRIRSTDARGSTTVFYYDAAGRQVYRILKSHLGGEVHASRYTGFGEAALSVSYTRRLSVADTAALTGGPADATLDSKIATLADSSDQRTQASYNQRGLIQQAIDALGFKTDTSYNAFGQVRRTDAAAGSTVGDGRVLRTDYTYDRRGLLTATAQDPQSLNIQTRAEYDAFGRQTASVDARGYRSSTQYVTNDGSGRQVVLTDAAGARSTTVYDAFDRVVRRTDALGYSVTFTHDTANRRVTMTDALGIQTVTESTRHGQVAMVTDGTGASTTYRYDKNGNLLSRTDALGNVTSSSYDAADNLVAQSNPGMAVTRYTFDAANRLLTRQVDPDGLNLRTAYEYDGQGRAVKVTDAAGSVTSYRFDAKGELTETVVDDTATGLKLRTTTAYDAQGRTLSVTEGAGTAGAKTTEYRYDLLGRRTQEVADPAGLKLTTTYGYDAAGNVVLRRDAVGAVTRYVYDAAGRQTYSVDAEGSVTQFEYDAAGHVVAKRELANPMAAGNGVKLKNTDGQWHAIYKGLGTFKAGDTVTATVRFKAPAGLSGEMFLGDAGGADPYDNSVGMGLPGNDGWQTITLTRTMSHDDVMMVFIYNQVASSDPNAGVIYDDMRITSRLQGEVLAENFDLPDPASRGWGIGATYEIAPLNLSQIGTQEQLTAFLPTLRDPARDRATRYVYDAAGRQTYSVDAVGSVTQFEYDATGHVVAKRELANPMAAGNGVKLKNTDGQWHAIYKGLGTFKAGDTVTATVRFKAPAGLSGEMFLGDAGGADPYDNSVGMGLPGNDGWQTLTLTRTMSHDDVMMVFIYDQIASSDPNAGVIYDDMRVSSRLQGDVLAENFDSDPASRGWGMGATYEIAPLNLSQVGTQEQLTAFLPTLRDPARDRVTRYVYDTADRQTYSVDAAGSVTQFEYDAAGRVVAKRELANQMAAGNGVKLKNTDGQWHAIYKGLGTFKAGDTVTATVRFKAPAGLSGEMFLGDAGGADPYDNSVGMGLPGNDGWQTITLTRTMSHDDVMMVFIYDQIASSDPNAGVIYDDMRVTSRLQGDVLAENFDSDPASRGWGIGATYEIAPLNLSQVGTQEQLAAFLPTLRDPVRDRVTRYVYDPAGRQTYSVDAAGSVTQFEYDATGHVVAKRELANPMAAGNGVKLKNTDGQWHAIYKDLGTFKAGDTVTATVRFKAPAGLSGEMFLGDAGGADPYDNSVGMGLPGNDGWQTITLTRTMSHDDVMMVFIYDQIASSDPNAGVIYDDMRVSSRLQGDVLAENFDSDPASRGWGMGATYEIAPLNLSQVGTQEQLTAFLPTLRDAARDRATRYVYDAAGRQTYSVDAVGSVTQFEYDATGHVVAKRELANPMAAGNGVKLKNTDGQWHAIYKGLGTFKAGDTVTATVRFKAPAGLSGEMFLGDAGGADPYDNSVGMGLPGNDGWQTITLTRTMSHDDVMMVFIYDQIASSDPNAGVIYDDMRVTSRLQGDVLAENFDSDPASRGWGIGATYEIAPLNLSQVGTQEQLAAFLPTLRDPVRDRVTRYVYDPAGRQTYSVDAAGSVTQFEYDATGHVVAKRELANPMAAGNGVKLKNTDGQWHAIYKDLGTFKAGDTVTATVRFKAPAGLSGEMFLGDAGGADPYDNSVGMGLPGNDGWQTITLTRTMSHDDVMMVFIYDQIASSDPNAGVIYDNMRVSSRLQGDVLAENFDSDPASRGWGMGATYEIAPLNLSQVGTQEQLTAFLPTLRDAARDRVTRYVYDAAGHPTHQLDPENYLTTHRYDASGNLTETIKYASRVQRPEALTQTPGSQVTILRPTDPIPATSAYLIEDPTQTRRTTYEYTALNQLRRTTDAEGHTESTTYNAFGDAATSTNKLGGTAAFQYDSLGRLIQETLPIQSHRADGTLTPVVNRYEYDSHGNRIRTIEAFGLPEQRITTFTYDAKGRQVSETGEAVTVFADGVSQAGVAPTTTRRFDALGRQVLSTGPNGARVFSFYDAAGRKTAELSEVTPGTGQLQAWTFDAAGNVLCTTVYGDLLTLPATPGGPPPTPINPANARTTWFTYDALGRVTSEQVRGVTVGAFRAQPDGYDVFTANLTTTQVYDAAGNVVQQTDARGNSTYSYYDGLGRKILQVDRELYVTRWVYNDNLVTELRYANRTLATPQVSSSPAALLPVPDATNDRVTTSVLDRLGRVVERRVGQVVYGSQFNDATGRYDQQTGSAVTRYVLDGLGHLLQQTDADGQVSRFAYDALGRQVSQSSGSYTGHADAARQQRTAIQYNGLGLVVQETRFDADDATTTGDRITTYAYDTLGRRTLATGPAGTVQSLYDAAGHLSATLQDVVDADGGQRRQGQQMRFDLLGRQTQQRDVWIALAANGAPVGTWAVENVRETRYNAYGQVTGKRLNGGGAQSTWQEWAEYDAAGRMVRSNTQGGVARFFVYDQNGNATLTFESTGAIDFADPAYTLEQARAAGADAAFSISVFDRRDQVVQHIQPNFTVENVLAAFSRQSTDVVGGTLYSGGTVAVTKATSISAAPVGGTAALGRVSATSVAAGTYVSAKLTVTTTAVSSGTFMGSTGTIPVYYGTYVTRINNLVVAVPGLGWYGEGDYQIEYSDSSGVSASTRVGSSTTTAFLNLPAGGSGAYTVSIYKWLDANVRQLVSSGSGNVAASGSWQGATVPPSVTGPMYLNLAVAARREIQIAGQPGNAASVTFEVQAPGTTAWVTKSAVQKTVDGVKVPGWFVADASAWSTGSVQFRYTALDAAGNKVNAAVGDVKISADSVTAVQYAEASGATSVPGVSTDGTSLTTATARVLGVGLAAGTSIPVTLNGKTQQYVAGISNPTISTVYGYYRFFADSLTVPLPALAGLDPAKFVVEFTGTTDGGAAYTSTLAPPLAISATSATLQIGKVVQGNYSVNLYVLNESTGARTRIATGAGNVPAGGSWSGTGGSSSVGSVVSQVASTQATTVTTQSLPKQVLFKSPGDNSYTFDQVEFGYRLAGSGAAFQFITLTSRAIAGTAWSWSDTITLDTASAGLQDNQSYEYVLLAVGNGASGTREIKSRQTGSLFTGSSPTVSTLSQPMAGGGYAYLRQAGNNRWLDLLDLGRTPGAVSPVGSATIRYRVSGANAVWSTATALTDRSATARGWWAFNTNGLTGTYDFVVETRNAAGALVSQVAGTMELGTNTRITGYQLFTQLPSTVTFASQPANAQSMVIRWTYKSKTLSAVAPTITQGVTAPLARQASGFVWDASALVPDALGNYLYEYTIEAFDGANGTGQVVNKATGQAWLGVNAAEAVTLQAQRSPTLVSFTAPPDTPAGTQLRLRYRLRASDDAGATAEDSELGQDTRPYQEVLLSLVNGRFEWNASALNNGSVQVFDYVADLLDAGGQPYSRFTGTARIGDPTPAGLTQLRATVSLSQTPGLLIARRQGYNAFGEISLEIDGRGNRRDLAYNTLGLLVDKTEAQTTVTAANGYSQASRANTHTLYSLGGRLLSSTDANGNATSVGYAANGVTADGSALVVWERHADGSRKTMAYDEFGQLRRQTNELNLATTYDYDRAGRLVTLTRPQRVAGSLGALPSAPTQRYEYNQLGQRIATTNELGFRSKLFYDAQGRLSRSVDAEGTTTTVSYTYDAGILGVGGKQVGGWRQVTTTGAGTADARSLTEDSDYFGHNVFRQDLGGHTFVYRYDHAGHLTQQTGSTGQDIRYAYYANGYVKSITDAGLGVVTSYGYDADGNRSSEGYRSIKTTLRPVEEVYQAATVTYDALNRIQSVVSRGGSFEANIEYEYDAVGNVRHILSTYKDGDNGNTRVQDLWYDYDAMNRFVVSQGTLKLSGVQRSQLTSASDTRGRVERGAEGIAVGYDAAGQRRVAIYGDGTATGASASYSNDGHQEDYSYTTDGYLETVKINGVERASRTNDAAGRVTQYVQYDASHNWVDTRSTIYRKDNLADVVSYSKGTGDKHTESSTKNNYLKDGTLDNTVQRNWNWANGSQAEGASVTTNYTYEWWDGAKQKDVKIQADWAPGWSSFAYDVNGHTQAVIDHQGIGSGTRELRYVTDAKGQILRRDENVSGQLHRWRQYYYLDGRRIGDVSNDGPSREDYAQALAAQRDERSKEDRYKDWKPIYSADFDQNYEPITPDHPGAASSTYTAREGDSLQAIAAAVWGDGQMWYLLAEANGLTGSEALTEGQVLVIPNKVTNIHNNSSTVRPYSPGEALGDTSPTLPMPPPKGDGCGTLGQIIMIVVAVVVTAVTGGAALAAMGPVLAGAVGAMAGSIVSQGVGMAMGMQSEFSWKAVGQAGLAGGIGGGLGASGMDVGGSVFEPGGWAASATNAAVATGANMTLHGDWSWRQLAGSAVGAGFGGDPTTVGGGAAWTSAAALGSRFAGNWLSNRITQRRADPRGAWIQTIGQTAGDSIAAGLRSTGYSADEMAGDFRRENNRFAAAGTSAGTGSSGSGLRIAQNIDADGWPRYGFDEPMLPADYSLTGGQPGRLPSAEYATVQGGNTLEGIAGGDRELIGRYIDGMGLRNPNMLPVGQALVSNWDMSSGDAVALANRFYVAVAQARAAAMGSMTQTADPVAAVLGYAQSYPALAREVAGYDQLVAAGLMTTQQAQDSLVASPRAYATLRSDYETPAAIAAGGPSLVSWDGVSRDSPAVAYMKQASGGLDPVRGGDFGWQVAQQLPEAMLAVGAPELIPARFASMLGRGMLAAEGLIHGERAMLMTSLRAEMRFGLQADLKMQGGLTEGVLVQSTAEVAPGLASFELNSSRSTHAAGINFLRESTIRRQMGRTPAGQQVLNAADSGQIDLVFSSNLSPPRGVYGEVPPKLGGTDPTAIVYLKNVQNGRSYDLLNIKASGYDLAATTGIHEGLHALGVGGSRRAEALVRLEELRNLGVPIDRLAMRQVLTDMRGGYDSLPWLSGRSTPYFSGLRF